MKQEELIRYRRVSTDKQGQSGLGLEAQDEAIHKYSVMRGSKVIKSFTEVESGKRNDRPELTKALAHARRTGATVVIAKLDRLTRNTRFLLELIESGADVAFCELPDLPTGPMGKFFLTMMVAVAELEVGLVSQRTRNALAAYKARGGKLGAARIGHELEGQRPAAKLTPELAAKGTRRSVEVRRAKAIEATADLAQEVKELRESGATLAQIAEYLTAEGHTTPRGKTWGASQVKRVLDRT